METRDFEIGLYKLVAGEAVSITVPLDAELHTITEVGGEPYAVFVLRQVTQEEVDLRKALLERIGG